MLSQELKTRNTKSCSLQVCKFLKRNPVRDHLLGIFCKFQSNLKRFRSSFLVASQTVCCKTATPVKGELLEISAMHVVNFSTELQNVVSVTFLKCDSTTDALPAILNKQKEHLRWSQFSVQLQVGGLGSSNFLKGTLLKTFFDNFP